MNIDFEKLINQLLPTSLRAGLIDIVRAFAASFTSIYEAWQNWYTDIILQSSITCQVMYIELILNYRLFGSTARIVYITDGDQITSDFVVNVPAGTVYNVQLLVGLLDKYKPTGKRYVIGQSDIIYQIDWTNFVCEKVDQQFSYSWTNPVCELVNKTINRAAATRNSKVDSGGAHQYAAVYLDYNATSNLTIIVSTDLGNYTVNINAGSKMGETPSGIFNYNTCYILSITPSLDETYYYKKSIWPL